MEGVGRRRQNGGGGKSPVYTNERDENPATGDFTSNCRGKRPSGLYTEEF